MPARIAQLPDYFGKSRKNRFFIQCLAFGILLAGCNLFNSDNPPTAPAAKEEDTLSLHLKALGDTHSFISNAKESRMQFFLELPAGMAFRIHILAGGDGGVIGSGLYRKYGQTWGWLPEGGGLLVRNRDRSWSHFANFNTYGQTGRQYAVVLRDIPGEYGLSIRYQRPPGQIDTCRVIVEPDSFSRYEPANDETTVPIDPFQETKAEVWPAGYDWDRFSFTVPRDTALIFRLEAKSPQANLEYLLLGRKQGEETVTLVFGTLSKNRLSLSIPVELSKDWEYYLRLKTSETSSKPFREEDNAYVFGLR